MTSSAESPPISTSRSYTIGGVEIVFPHKAYPSQIAMMDKIVRCLTKKQNCLLESPTGSGKSLALLCSALAWQRKFERDIASLATELEAEVRNASDVQKVEPVTPLKPKDYSRMNQNTEPRSILKSNQVKTVDLNSFAFVAKTKSVISHPVFIDDDDEDFQPIRKKVFLNPSFLEPEIDDKSLPLLDHVYCSTPINSRSETKTFSNVENSLKTEVNECASQVPEIKQQVFTKKRPQIFFGTRTHKQISQIIRELKKTIYKDAKMTILSSRDRTCINPIVWDADNKQDACNDLINDVNSPGCSYYRSYRKISHQNPSRLAEAWDIEELVTKLKSMRTCPYFSARILMVDSDIIFCPYNYLIDPIIRSSLDINLRNNIIILDEAHNIEDSAREAASWTVTHYQLFEAVSDLTKIAPQCKGSVPIYYDVSNVLSAFYGWFCDSQSLLKQDSFDIATNVYSGAEMVAIFEHIGVGPENYNSFECNISIILTEENDQEVTENRDKLTGGTIFLLKSFLVVLNFIYKDNLKYMPDYRCILSKKRSKFMTPNSRITKKVNAIINASQSFANSNNRPSPDLSANFCCLNPAVAFSDIKESIHTLVVASGTLSPMASFQSELEMPFDITFEANHVVCRSQMWIGTIGSGPAGSALCATFRNTEMFSFQDDIGKLILEICTVVPYGVLCFVSSYGMLDKLTSRWQTTGLWSCLESKKFIVCEPRGQSKDFDRSIAEYYDAVKESRTNCNMNGALLIAVCRGKVSEGLDFADDNARAVITIGIPFPNFKDTQVDLKKKYNDINHSRKRIMSGSEWYETQAFRALNQALGRCIRHRNDFGALILVDERFQKNQRYVNCLSKWIRKEIIHYNSSSTALQSLKEFSMRTQENSSVVSSGTLDESIPLIEID